MLRRLKQREAGNGVLIQRRQVRGRRNPYARRSRIPRGVQIPECTRKYALARYDPFHPDARGACIPDAINIPSMKFTLMEKGFAAPGTTGHGFVYFDPRNPTSDQPCALHTNTTSVGTGATALNAFTFLTQDFWPNALFTAAQFGATGLRYRVVGAGMRVYWTGPRLNMSGRVHGANAPNFTGIAAYTLQETVNYFDVEPTPLLAKARELPMSLSNPDDQLQYRSVIDDVVTADGAMMIGWSGVDITPGANTLAFELVAHYEIIGPNAAGTSVSETDITGFGAVNSIVSDYNRTHSGAALIDKLTNFLIAGTSRVLSNPESAGALANVGTKLLTAAASV